MTSTVTTTVDLSMIGLQRLTSFKQKNPWPNPERSIGISWCPLGKNWCWEAVGPAQEIARKILCKIKDILESQHEYLNEGVCIRRVLLFGLYMIGRTKAQARPTIVFSCEDKIQRQRAMKAVKESAILDGHSCVCLGESSRPPRLSSEPQQLGGLNVLKESVHGDETHAQGQARDAARRTIENGPEEVSRTPTLSAQRSQSDDHTKDVEMTGDTNHSSPVHNMVYYISPLGGVHGIPIIIKDATGKAPNRDSTVRGFICVGEQLFGLTVAHTFQDSMQDNKETKDDDIEFSFEDDSEDEGEVANEHDFIYMTSRGSMSPDQSLFEGSTSADTTEHNSPKINLKASPSATLNRIESLKGSTEHVLSPLGRLAVLSEASQTSDLDWALIRIDSPLPLSIHESPRYTRTQSVAREIPRKSKIQVMTTTEYIIQGTITGGSTFMQLPHSVAFQEMWSVQLDGPLRHGNCGSWVVDFESGEFYGYITAGDPRTSIAYIVPAYQAFRDIEQRLNKKVNFPSFEETSSLQRAQTPEKASLQSQTLFSPPQHEKVLVDGSLPKGDCRYILLHAELKGLRCSCTGLMRNRSIPGSTCDCGHQACYHALEKDSTSSEGKELVILRNKVALLEKELDRERHKGLTDRLGQLEDLVDKMRTENENDFKNTHQNIAGLWQHIGTLIKQTSYYDDQIEGLIDDAERMRSRLTEIDDASMCIKDRVEQLEGSSITTEPITAKQISEDEIETGSPTDPQPRSNVELAHIQMFRERLTSLGTKAESWTVHVSLLPTASQPFPFEKDTAAYKRCLSRGLNQMIVITNTDHESFTAAVNEAFSKILRGRPWQPLIARTCDARNLRGLPMLRQLPDRLNSGNYDADFLQKNCAIMDEEGKILDIYIAMVEDSLSWAELKAIAPYTLGLDSSWTYDPLLDGPYNEGGEHNLGVAVPDKLHPAGDILPPWSPSRKRKESDMSRTPSFSSSSQPQRSSTGMGGKRRREETQPRYII